MDLKHFQKLTFALESSFIFEKSQSHFTYGGGVRGL